MQLFFVITHWAQTKKGFLTSLAGAVLIVLGALAMPREPVQPANDTAAAAPLQTTTHASFERVTASISGREEVQPQPRPAPQAVAAPVEEPPRPTVTKVYVDNTTELYYPSDGATHPDNAFQMSKAPAISQGYKPAVCK